MSAAENFFDTNFGTLKRFTRKGEVIKHGDLDKTNQVVGRALRGVRPAFQRIPSRVGQTSVALYRVKSVEEDHLICHTWDGISEGSQDIKVALPYLLRRTPFDNDSRNDISYVYSSNIQRTASKTGEADEEQVIVPSYQVDDEITATSGITGGTGVTVDASPIVLIDDNRDARAWAKKTGTA